MTAGRAGVAHRVEVETFLERERREAIDDAAVRSMVHSLCDDQGREKYGSLLRELREFAPDLLEARDGEIRVSVSRDAMEVELKILPPLGDGRRVSAEDVFELLRARGVVHGIAGEVVESAVRKSAQNSMRTIIARGTPVVPGKSMTIELVEPADSRLFVKEVAGAVDLKTFSRIRTIQEGEIVANITPSHPGVDGRTCLGTALIADASPEGSTWTLGDGVIERDGHAVASRAGQLCKDGGKLSVLPILVITGNVDYGTGNIVFPGSVHIKGDVMDQFSVHCSGSLRVGGNVYAANLDATGDIEIRGGIVGRDSGCVRAGGSITAKYIESAMVEAAGDIVVTKAIVHSHVSANGWIRLTARPGVIMGGETHAARGIACACLGGVSSTRTNIRVGENFLHARKMVRLRQSAEFLKKELFSLNSQRSGNVMRNAADSKIEIFDRQMARIREGLRTLLTREVQLASQESEVFTDWTVEVREKTYPGVCFFYQRHGKTFDVEASASSFRFDASTQSIAVGTLTPGW